MVNNIFTRAKYNITITQDWFVDVGGITMRRLTSILIVMTVCFTMAFSSFIPAYAKDSNTSISNTTKVAVSTGQKNALKSAKQYLKVMPFSRQGLIDQLSSPYGENFTVDEATYAVNKLEEDNAVDWNTQAIKAAQSYLESMSFSRKGLLSQLTSDHASQFTSEQAEIAIAYLEENNLVDWNAEAVEAAQAYTEYMTFSRQRLIDQLTSEYGSQFTMEQAEYAVSAVGY